MVAALNESCHNRALVKKDLDEQGNVNPATSRVTTLSRLSPQNRARELGLPVPGVRGISKAVSEGQAARQGAKEMEDEVRSLEEADKRRRARTGIWTDEQEEAWHERKRLVEQEWEHAHRLSYAAGHDFTDRLGRRHYISQESIVARAVRTYLRESSRKDYWVHVQGWIEEYTGRKRQDQRSMPAAKRRR